MANPPAYGRLRVLAVASALLLGGCGGAAATPAAPQPSPAATRPTPPSTSSTARPAPRPAVTSAPPAPAPKDWDAKGPSYGVDRTGWPGTVKEAAPGLRAMPRTLAGERRQVSVDLDAEEGFGASAGISYGDAVSLDLSEEYNTTDTPNGKPELMSADNLLAASFGMVFGCAEGSYAGTFPQGEDYPGPAVSEQPLRTSAWFSCRIDTAEGDEDFTGEAVGWTSGKTAWLVVGPDKKTVRSLVTALHQAVS